MSFLGMGPFEIIIILLVAFIFLGPERMADAARTLGKWTSELRRATAGVRAEMDDLIADDPTQPVPTTRVTQTRPANADAPAPDETRPNAPIDPSAPTAGDEVAPNAAADSDAPVAFRSARAKPPPPAAPPKPPSDAAPTPDATPNRAPTEDNP